MQPLLLLLLLPLSSSSSSAHLLLFTISQSLSSSLSSSSSTPCHNVSIIIVVVLCRTHDQPNFHRSRCDEISVPSYATRFGKPEISLSFAQFIIVSFYRVDRNPAFSGCPSLIVRHSTLSMGYSPECIVI